MALSFVSSGIPLPVSSAAPLQLSVDATGPLAQARQLPGCHGESSRPVIAAMLAAGAGACVRSRQQKRRERLTRKSSEQSAPVSVGEADTWDLFFEDYATWFTDHFDLEFGLTELPLRPGFASRKGQSEASAGAEIRTRLFEGKHAGSPIKKLRLTMVCNGTQLQALNAVVYPSCELGMLPILGIDLLSFNGHARTLYGLDWSPMSPEKTYADEHIAPYVADIKNGEHAALASAPGGKIYGEDPEFFSPYMFFARPEGEGDLLPGSGL